MQLVIAIGPSTASMMSARLIPCAARARVKPPPVPRAEVSRPAPASRPINFCAVGSGTPVSAASRPAVSRAPTGWRAPLRRAAEADPVLATSVAGLAFPNPVGLAAGFDKDAEVFTPMLGLGFGSVEVGTLTPRPQAGNPKPRLFRLAEDGAVINRMGFNNSGQAAAKARLAGRGPGIVGVNIGANKDSADRIADYVA